MVAVGVPMWGDVGGGWDVWLPLYVGLSFGLVLAVTGWRLTRRSAFVAFAGGLLWSWATAPLGVIPAAAAAGLTVASVAILRSRRASGLR